MGLAGMKLVADRKRHALVVVSFRGGESRKGPRLDPRLNRGCD